MTHVETAPDSDRLTEMYRSMVRIRRFEEQVADLIVARELGTPCHLCIGQEAIATGVCEALETTDTIWGAHRSHGHYLAKGGDMRALMAEIFCRSTGCSGGRGGSMHICAPEVGVMGTVPIVAATIPIAVGAAMASALRGDNAVSVTFFGDGSTEEGHFHESVNLAAVRRLPVIFVCENNLYSSHMGLLERRAVDRIPDFGSAHGIPGLRIDGNDVGEVLKTANESVERARAGDGPTLIECRTFRWRGHVGAAWDEDVGVKRKGELKEWLTRDPIARCADELQRRGVASSVLDEIEEQTRQEIADALEFARSSPSPSGDEFANHVYRVAG
jgi:TPP-dependent pyruvate/acetoin dehydrogenase alpha subunit